MAKFSRFDKILMIATTLFVSTDIILALCIGLVLPDYVTKRYYYHPDGKKYDFDTAALRCPCLYRVYPEGTEDNLMVFEKIGPHAMDEIINFNSTFANQDGNDMSQISFNNPDGKVIDKRAANEATTSIPKITKGSKGTLRANAKAKAHSLKKEVPDAKHISTLQGIPKRVKVITLSIPAYCDDSTHYMFACAGIATSPRTVLTTTHCVRHNSEWTQLKVNFFNYHVQGALQHVLRYDTYENGSYGSNLVLVTFEHILSFLYIPLAANITVSPKAFSEVKYAVSLGWDDEWYKRKADDRKIDPVLTQDIWAIRESGNENKSVCFNDKYDKNCKILSKFLVTKCYDFLGVQTSASSTCGSFSGLTFPGFDKPQCYPIKRCELNEYCASVPQPGCTPH